MGFRKGAYATVWEARQGNGNYTQARISTSRKDKEAEEYRTEFNGWVRLIGEAHNAAYLLGERARIRIGDCDVTNKYDKERNITYTNYAIFSFEAPDRAAPESARTDDDGFIDVSGTNMDELPFA